MANLQVRDIDNRLYKALKRKAELEHRSISQEVVRIIESHLMSDNSDMEKKTNEFLKLSNGWIDERDADEIVKDLRSSRSNRRRTKVIDEFFD